MGPMPRAKCRIFAGRRPAGRCSRVAGRLQSVLVAMEATGTAGTAVGIGAGERRAVVGLAAAALAYRVFAVFRQGVNSDEPQHLHVVWAWTQGLLPYRDVFDNHMPLFQVAAAPALLAVGERPEAVLYMRLFMLPVWALAAWLVFRIGRALFSARVGVWAALAAALWPAFYWSSLQFRPDTLWAVCWLATIAVLVEGPLSPGRAFAAGVLLGTAAGISMKTVMLAASLAMALVTTLVVLPRRPPATRVWHALVAGACGAVIVPSAVTAYFTARGALAPYVYNVFGHNMLPDLGTHTRSAIDLAAAAAFVVATGAAARLLVTRSPDGARRAFVLVAAATYAAVLEFGWPLVTMQDQLPLVPVVAPFVVAALMQAPAGRRWVAVGVAVELVLLLGDPGVWRAAARTSIRLETAVLRLTDDGDFVMDEKGESIFRPRPTYWVMEGITRERLRRGLIPDDFADRLVATRTTTVAGYGWVLPARSRRFVSEHYLRVEGRPFRRSVFVAGRRLDSRGDTTFTVPFALSYALVGARGEPHGVLDGAPYDGARVLEAGVHTYRAAPGDGPVALLWAKAAACGFRPSWTS